MTAQHIQPTAEPRSVRRHAAQGTVALSPLLLLLALGGGTPRLEAQRMLLPEAQLTTYVALEQPTKLAFDPAGNLYVGHDDNLAPQFVRKIEAITKTASPLGVTPLRDLDTVAFDAAGAASGRSGSVLVGAADELWTIHPDNTMTRLAGAEAGLENVQTLAFDLQGRLLVGSSEAAGEGGHVFRWEGGVPQPLFSLYRPDAIAVHPKLGDIFVGSAGGGVTRYSEDGLWLAELPAAPDYTSGLAFDRAGRLFAVGHSDDQLYELALDGSSLTAIGEGFASGDAIGHNRLAFGPDNALYLSQPAEGKIWRIVIPEPAAMLSVATALLVVAGWRRRRRA